MVNSLHSTSSSAIWVIWMNSQPSTGYFPNSTSPSVMGNLVALRATEAAHQKVRAHALNLKRERVDHNSNESDQKGGCVPPGKTATMSMLTGMSMLQLNDIYL